MVEKKQKLIVVLGMHRSGTSVVTRGLKVMGVQLGDRLLHPIKGVNEKGYWEDIDIYLLNVDMLAEFSREWFHLAVVESIDVEVLHQKGYFIRAVELLRQKTKGIPVFGFKDPRVAKLLPFWKAVFEHLQLDVSYILVIRHPLSVAKSLAKRDNIPETQSHLIWLGHIISALTGTSDFERAVVNYDALMKAPEYELNRIAKILNLKIDTGEMQNFTSEFIDQELRHTVYQADGLLENEACPLIVADIYITLLKVASDKISLLERELKNKQKLWATEFERLKSPMILIDNLVSQNKIINKVLAESNKQVKDLNQTTLGQKRDFSNLNLILDEQESVIMKLNQTLTEKEGEISDLSQCLSQISKDLGVSINSRSWVIAKPLKFYYQSLFNRPRDFIIRKLTKATRNK